jgi:hypothetical protein
MNDEQKQPEKQPERISAILEQIAIEICESRCKYPDLWDEEAMGMELCESEVCAHCPLNRF